MNFRQISLNLIEKYLYELTKDMLPKLLIRTLLLCFVASLNSCHSSKYVLPAWLEKHRQERLTLFRSENRQLGQQRYTILLGNSLTEGFPIEKYFADKPVLNRGIVADHTGIEGHGILQRLKVSVYDCQAEKVFLMIGINDLADKTFTPRQIAYGVRLIIEKIQKFDPELKIYLYSTLPTSGKYNFLNSLVLIYNQLLEQLATELNISYINLHPHFINEFGDLKSEYSRDGLHLTDVGYQTWYHAIMPYFSEEAGN